MKAKSFCFYVILLLSIPLFSQEQILLKGEIKADSLAGSAINIINLSQKTGTTNLSNGTFAIEVKQGDTLFFSSVQYEKIEIIINSEILRNSFLMVELKQQVNELGEVQLSNISLTGNLEKDLENMTVFNQAAVGFPLRDYRKPSQLDRLSGALETSPLFLLINTFSGKKNRMKRAREYIMADKIIDRGIAAVPTRFYTKALFIPEEEIMLFVSFCAEDNSFKDLVVQANTLKLMEFYYEKAPSYFRNQPVNPLIGN